MNETVLAMKSSVSRLAYSSVQIEGIGSTFAQTREIMEEGKTKGLTSEDATKLVGIKHGLELMFSEYGKPLSWDLYARYNVSISNGLIEKAGIMRGPGEVRVDDFIPKDEISIVYFNDLVSTAVDTAFDAREAACNIFGLLSRAQFFYDGNKRSAQMMANHYLAHQDASCALIIGEAERSNVIDLLVSFYHGDISLQDFSWDLEALAIEDISPKESIDSLRDREGRSEPQQWPGQRDAPERSIG